MPEVRRSLTMVRNPEAGTMRFTLEVPMDTGLLIEKALDKARDDTLTDGAEMQELDWSARQADALVTLARAFLSGAANDGNVTSPNYQVTVHVDHSALQGQGGRSGLPLQTLKRLGCDADAVLLVENGNGEPLSVGSRTRVIRRPDGRCRPAASEKTTSPMTMLMLMLMQMSIPARKVP